MAWVLDEFVQEEVDRLKRLRVLVDNLPAAKITLVGDVILDRYIHGWANRLNAVGPVPVVKVTHTDESAGAAAHVAMGLSSLGLNPSIFAVIGSDDAGRTVDALLRESGVNTSGLKLSPGRNTVVKTRVYGARESLIDRSQLLLQVDEEPLEEVAESVTNQVTKAALASLATADAFVLSDYNKGTITDESAAQLIEAAKARGIPVICDPKLTGLTRTTGATTVVFEMRGLELTRRRLGHETDEETAQHLIEKYSWESLTVLGGRHGLWLYRANGETEYVPCTLDDTSQMIGLHDAAAAALAAALSQGAELSDAARLAHVACECILKVEEGQEVLDRRILSASLDERAWAMQISDR
jgi:D-beta-D-heptose 7-phosphate kinase/D-beta-D-heptose 1-phosphate adenosyltransferase